MKKFWQKLPIAYKIFALILLFLALVEVVATLFIWQFESNILLQKERQNLTQMLQNYSQRILSHLDALQKETKFLASLEVMDDIVAKDIDKRILSLLEHKAKDLAEGIILLISDQNDTVIISPKPYLNLPLQAFRAEYLLFQAPVYASFDKQKQLGKLILLYPYENLQHLHTDTPSRKLWLKPPAQNIHFKTPQVQNALVVSKTLPSPLQNWQINLSFQKEEALATLKNIEKVQLYTFFISTVLLAVIIFILSKRLTLPLLELLKNSEKALEAKSTFLSTISHELRTPLGSILNLTQHLTLSPKADEEMRKMLSGIETSAQHLLSMINNILQLSKLEAKSIVVQKEQVNLNELIEEISEIVTPLVQEKEITFIQKTDIKHHTIISDSNLLKQVMINLLSNAVKFTQKGQIVMKLQEDKGEYRFSVEDTGIGISKTRQKDLFTPFFQAHTDLKTLQNSSGLGLALSQKVAGLLGGEITIYSAGTNKGTKASFTFRSF